MQPTFVRVTQPMAAVAVLLAAAGIAQADQPPAAAGGDSTPASSATAAQVPSGNFFSSLKQAFKQDFDKEVVRGHFDVDSHRYYCLVDAKTGKREVNGAAGQPFVRPDGMTGIKSGAVSLYSCATAEQQGNLVTTGYVLSAGAAGPATPAAAGAPPPTAPAAVSPAPPPVAPPTTPSRAAAAAGVPVAAADIGTPEALFARFIAALNAHDRSAVSGSLSDSPDLVWIRLSGESVWGREAMLDALQADWQGAWSVESQSKDLRTASLAPGVVAVVAPMVLTHGAPGETPSTTALRWSGIFVKAGGMWRIAAIFNTPNGGRPPH